jgi:hypothetical protein
MWRPSYSCWNSRSDSNTSSSCTSHFDIPHLISKDLFCSYGAGIVIAHIILSFPSMATLFSGAHIPARTYARLLCRYCGKHYFDGSTLKRHIRNVHFKEKKFKCEFCPATFTQNSNRKSHERKMHTYGQRNALKSYAESFPWLNVCENVSFRFMLQERWEILSCMLF